MRYLILSTSLSPKSRSRVLAEELQVQMQEDGHAVELIDLRDHPLPFCDAATCYGDPNVALLQSKIDGADGIVMATPIYNYTLGGTAKNLVELTGKHWTGKVVSFLCAAGGANSYMAIMGTAASLMLDFRCVVVPRFVYATGDAFEDGALTDSDVRDRLEQLGRDLARMTAALSG